jgi:hypothetical protein
MTTDKKMVHSAQERSVPTEEQHPPILARMDMIVEQLQGLPHVVATCREAANLIREMDAHLHAIRSVDGSCPQCSDTKRDCANAIAEIMVQK